MLVALGASLGGCSSTAQQPPLASPSPAVSAAPLPDMWTVHADPSEHFSVATPEAWDFLLRDSPSFVADLEAVGKHSPELQAYFKKAMETNAELRLVAADGRSLAGGFAANVNVMRSDLGAVSRAPTLGELATAKVTRLGNEAAVMLPVKRADVRVAGRPAVRIDYQLKAGDHTVSVRSYLLVMEHGGQRAMLELTMGAAADQAAATFDGIASSLTLPGA